MRTKSGNTVISSGGSAKRSPSLRSVAPDLWIAERPLKLPLALGHLGSHMTVVRLANSELFLHSPVLLDASIRAALDKLGPVQAIVAPSRAHHLFVGDYLKAYPDARLHGAPGLAEKRQDLKFDVTLAISLLTLGWVRSSSTCFAAHLSSMRWSSSILLRAH